MWVVDDVEVAVAFEWCAFGNWFGEVRRNKIFPDAVVVRQGLQEVAGGRNTSQVEWREVTENMVHELGGQLEQWGWMLCVLHGRRSAVTVLVDAGSVANEVLL